MSIKSLIIPLVYSVLIAVVAISTSSCRRAGKGSSEINSQVEPSTTLPPPVDFDIEKIKERGSLVAVLENSSTGFFIYKGQPMGYEYDLLELFAKRMDVELEIRTTASIQEAFEILNRGEADIIAYSLTVTKERKKVLAFTDNHYTTRQVLVQRKPENWRKLTRDELEGRLIRNQVDLIGKQIHVRKKSAYIDRLYNLSDEIGGDILILEESDSLETEKLIKMVANGRIQLTVADESVARVNAAYYPNIDVKTPIRFPQQIAWAVRKNSDQFLTEINDWLASIKKQPTYNVIFKKYFRNSRASVQRAKSDFSSFKGDKISIYDDKIKEASDSLGWDWLLLASQIFQESRFDPYAKSWAGAVGLMQLVPETGKRYGVNNLYDPHQSIDGGVKFMRHLDKLWSKTIKDKNERIKFILASYNVGLGHVTDARDLAMKYGRDPLKWEDNVEYFLLMKSKREFFRDPVVKSGYCRGEEPVNYVRDILSRYDQYRQLISS
ncbi:MAG: transporter substrate-binding domain-containing protein [Bacteroidota bacterium]